MYYTRVNAFLMICSRKSDKFTVWQAMDPANALHQQEACNQMFTSNALDIVSTVKESTAKDTGVDFASRTV
jgi:hypothetical protein